jgi:hypothetical protein
VLPVLLVITIVFIVVLQLDWMYRVSLHHLQHVAWTSAAPTREADAATRIRILTRRAPQQIVCVNGHSDAAFMASFAAIVVIAATVHWDWKSPQHWLHYYGVFLFCSGFFVMLQIVWFNLQRVSTVASLRHMPPLRGMHWVVDSAIIVLLLLFLMLNFMLGQTGALVVGSELLGFALLALQFLYIFNTCCCSSEPLVVVRTAAWKARLLVCLLLLLPYLLFAAGNL